MTIVAAVPERLGKIDSRGLSIAASLDDPVALGALAVPGTAGKISTPSFATLSHQ